MTAINDDRDTNLRKGDVGYYPMAATKIYKGTMVVFSSGYVTPATKTTSVMCVGVAAETVDNSGGSAGDKSIMIMRGVAQLTNDTVSAVNIGDVGKQCYILDNQTVTMDASDTSVAGRVFDVSSSGVWVEFTIIPRTAIVTSADIDEQIINLKKIVLNASQISTLHTTPVTIVGTPGAGKYIQFVSATLELNYLTAAYNNQNLQIGLNGGGTAAVTVAGTNFINATASTITTAVCAGDTIVASAQASNKNLAIKAAGDLGSTGKGTLDVWVYYRVITL